MRPSSPDDVVILSAKRTPFGAFGGALEALSATDLAVHASRAALAAAAVAPGEVGHVVMGNVLQTSADAIYLSRHVGLKVGVPQEVPALTVNRLCGSGFEAVVQAALWIRAGQAEVVLAGGTESMSQAPLVLRGSRWGHPLGRPPALEDALWAALTDSHVGLPMGLTAERLAEQDGITQDQVDEYAVLSQRRWAAAQAAGRFDEELAPLDLPGKKGPVRFDRDEGPRPDTTVEALRRRG
jgi:acetyl-CoA C-acetyltransferase/acetyl-CoA acyltransferase 2